jgi:CheY-like chemotaxis protein
MHACPAGDHLARGERPLSILVVEDEVLIRMMMANELRRAGYQVVEAAHADEALDVLKSSSRVDLMITDIAMPLGSMDGTKLVRFVRGRWPQTKVMIASAHPPEGPEALDAYIDKPVNPDKLIERVKDLLKI